MNDSRSRHLRALEVLPTPVRDILRADADLSQWSDFVINTIEKTWSHRQAAVSLDEIPAGEVLMCHRFLRPEVVESLGDRAEREMRLAVAPLQLKLLDDPWSLSHCERRSLADALTRHQAEWLPRLTDLVEPPPLANSFPAFLLETEPFAHLKDGVADSTTRAQLDTGTADELQRFVDHYRNYMVRTPAQQTDEREALPAVLTLA